MSYLNTYDPNVRWWKFLRLNCPWAIEHRRSESDNINYNSHNAATYNFSKRDFLKTYNVLSISPDDSQIELSRFNLVILEDVTWPCQAFFLIFLHSYSHLPFHALETYKYNFFTVTEESLYEYLISTLLSKVGQQLLILNSNEAYLTERQNRPIKAPACWSRGLKIDQTSSAPSL